MIEVEKKFQVESDAVKERLLEGAAFVGESTITDSYYDKDNYQLTSKDKWLRLRNGKWELKISMSTTPQSRRQAEQYDEIVNEKEIRKALQLPVAGTLAQDIETAGYRPFLTVVTTRRKYTSGLFTIDLDEMDFGYSVGEIELMVEKQEDAPAAVQKIIDFTTSRGIKIFHTRGKIIEYLYRFRPEHYQALVNAGVL